MDNAILCWLTQELYHMESDEPRSWTLAVAYIKRVSQWMRMVESSSTLHSMALCCLHTFVVNKKGCTSLCVPSIVVSGWRVSLFGCGKP